MSVGTTVWSTPSSNVSAGDRTSPGHRYQNGYEEHLAAKRVQESSGGNDQAPFNEGRNSSATLYTMVHDTTLDAVYNRIVQGEWRTNSEGERLLLRPNDKQVEFLVHFKNRLKIEND